MPGFVHHKQAQAVAKIQHFLGWRIVRSAIGVRAHLLEFAETELPDGIRHGHADTRVILVIAGALDLERFVVEEKSLPHIEANRAETAGGFDGIHRFIVPHDDRPDRVEGRLIHRPELRRGHRN